MNFFRIILTITFCVFNSYLLTAQHQTTNGLILSKEDSSIISHSHIINVNSKIGVTSNQKGEFSIKTELKDTLIISFVGYQSITVKVSEITSKIYLEKITYDIEAYTVLPYNNFKEFKTAFVNLKLKDTIKDKINPSIIAKVKPYDPIDINDGFFIRKSFYGQISSLAAKFNTRIKDRKNYENLLAKDRYKAFLATKFNSNIIKQVTTLRDNSHISSFMEYCDFTDHFIELSSQYNLFDQIIKCFHEYNNLPIVDD